MKADLKDFFSSDFGADDLKSYQPSNIKNFRLCLQLYIGPIGEESADSFQLSVVADSTVGLATEFEWRKQVLYCKEYNLEAILEQVKLVIACSTGDSWVELAKQLNQYFDWEFANYQPAKQMNNDPLPPIKPNLIWY